MWLLYTSAIRAISHGKWLPKTAMRNLVKNTARSGEGAASTGSTIRNTSYFGRLGGANEHVCTGESKG